MSAPETPGQARQRIAAAARQAVKPVDPCCVVPADGHTVTQDLFELKPVADGVYAATAAAQYKINCNAAIILTNDGAIVVDSHSKPSAARALFREIHSLTTQLAPQYERGMSKYPLGRYWDRIDTSIETVYHKVVTTG
jgi:hypothetical protein